MIGIDISDQTIKVVRLSRGHITKLLSHCMHVLPSGIVVNGIVVDSSAMEVEIRKALSSCSAGSAPDSVIASIPETQSFLRVVEIPTMTEDEIQEAVKWEIAQHIPFGLENVYIDWQPCSGEHVTRPGHQEVQVGAAQKKVVDVLYGVLHALRLDVAAFELESQAIVRSLISREWRLKQGVLIVDIGSTATNVIVYDQGASRFTASLQRGVVHLTSSLPPDDARGVLEALHHLPSDLVDRIQPGIISGLEQLVKDIKGIVDFYNGIDRDHKVQEIILTGGGSNLPGFDDVFLQQFDDVHIQRGNPWVNILSGASQVRPPLDLQESVRYTTALGLALRNAIPL
jgi:type IV pilus assembly protein PilM